MYLPPNSAANAHFLWVLRSVLVHDADQDNDGRPESLRLLYATPRRWLADGARIRVRRAPTAFGPVSLEVTSRLRQGEVVAQLDLPPQAAQHASLRFRLPAGWRLTGAAAGGTALEALNDETVSLRGLTGRVTVRARVASAR
jgi:hypothetical protein